MKENDWEPSWTCQQFGAIPLMQCENKQEKNSKIQTKAWALVWTRARTHWCKHDQPKQSFPGHSGFMALPCWMHFCRCKREVLTQTNTVSLTCWLQWSLWPSCPLRRPSAAPELQAGYWEPVMTRDTIIIISMSPIHRKFVYLFARLKRYVTVVGNQAKKRKHHTSHEIKPTADVANQFISPIGRLLFCTHR